MMFLGFLFLVCTHAVGLRPALRGRGALAPGGFSPLDTLASHTGDLLFCRLSFAAVAAVVAAAATCGFYQFPYIRLYFIPDYRQTLRQAEPHELCRAG